MTDKTQAILVKYKHLLEKIDDLILYELKECDITDKFRTHRTIAFKTSSIENTLAILVPA